MSNVPTDRWIVEVPDAREPRRYMVVRGSMSLELYMKRTDQEDRDITKRWTAVEWTDSDALKDVVYALAQQLREYAGVGSGKQ